MEEEGTDNMDTARSKVEITKRVQKLGRIYAELNMKVIDSEYNSLIRHCEPRPLKKVVKTVNKRAVWSFASSIWATIFDYNYDGDTEVKFYDLLKNKLGFIR